MHDLKFAQEALFILKREVNKLGGDAKNKPIAITVSLSPFSHVKPEGFKETFGHVIEGEGFKDVKVNVKIMEFNLYCKACKRLSKSKEPVFECPSCKSADLDMEMGREFFVDSIEVEGIS